jgi:putative membrane protein
MMYPYYNYGYGYQPGVGALGFALHAAVTVLVILAIVWLARRMFAGKSHGDWRSRWSAHSGLAILNERYAKGEIDKAEYEERKKTLLGA